VPTNYRATIRRHFLGQALPPPIALRVRLASVAVGTADLALGQLCLDRAPRKTTSRHIADVPKLVAHVIELENDRVGLATVDTRVFGLVSLKSRLVLGIHAQPGDADMFDVARSVPLIPDALVLDQAGEAPELTFRLSTVSESEGRKRLPVSAPPAEPEVDDVHRVLVPKSASREKSYFCVGGKNLAKSAGSTSASCSSGNRTTPASRNARATNSPQEYFPNGS